jgi:hypothetical protein
MKKVKKILFIGVIAMMMAAGLVLVGCQPVCSMDGTCYYTSPSTGSFCSDADCAAIEADDHKSGSSAKCDC